MANGDIFIGCAGYSYSGWKGDKLFYPRMLKDSDQLKHYAGVFPSVEINATFHGMQTEETFRKWSSSVRPGFVFVLKARQDMTHMNRLQNIDDQWRYFYDRSHSCLGSQLGPILFQLPPHFKREDARLEYLGSLLPGGCQVAVEFRHSSWLVPEVYAILRKYNMAVVENVTPDNSFPHTAEVTANFTYTRMHKALGSEDANIATWYSDAQLQPIADRAAERAATGITQFIFFLNDVDAAGPKNGQTLIEMIAKKRGKDVPLVRTWKAAKPATKSMESFFGKAAKKTKEEPEAEPEPEIVAETEAGAEAHTDGKPSSTRRGEEEEAEREDVLALESEPPSQGSGGAAASRPQGDVICVDGDEGSEDKAEATPSPSAKKAKLDPKQSKESPKRGTLLSFFGKQG